MLRFARRPVHLVLLIAAMVTLGALVGDLDVEGQPAKKEAVQIDMGVFASEIVHVYRTNAAAADERFSKKPTKVTGRMMRIRSEGVLVLAKDGKQEVRYDLEMAGGERLDPKTGNFLGYVTDAILHFHTPESDRAALAKLISGQKVTMEGTPEKLAPGKAGEPDELHFFNCKVIHAQVP